MRRLTVIASLLFLGTAGIALQASAGPTLSLPKVRKVSPPTKPRVTTPPKPGAPGDNLLNALKKTKSLSPAGKVDVLGRNGYSVKASDLDSPFTLSPRRPFLDAKRGMVFWSTLLVDPIADYAIIPKGGPNAQEAHAHLTFAGAPKRRYLVDCVVQGGWGDPTPISMRASDAKGGSQYASAAVMPSDGHISLVIPDSNTQRSIEVDIWDPKAGWYLDRCDITPVR